MPVPFLLSHLWGPAQTHRNVDLLIEIFANGCKRHLFGNYRYSKIPIQTEHLPCANENVEMGLKVTEPVPFSPKDVNTYSQESVVSSGVKEATAPKGAPDVGGSQQLQTSD
ncbi:hypothetical protein JEQ12_019072 [Ovis aries]|uniref:Uncharacterized protein n=1 Tax=Ovis aries TaxID=9940 RepID=A0A836AAX2_SHEEP|nr:hypothetical protein JEQ12_019072 [Ovis aries]